jgi:hypothetical protein
MARVPSGRCQSKLPHHGRGHALATSAGIVPPGTALENRCAAHGINSGKSPGLRPLSNDLVMDYFAFMARAFAVQ